MATVRGNASANTIVVSVASTVYADAGNDTVNGSSAVDQLYGDLGDDKLYGNGGNDLLWGGAGLDQLWGGIGNDQLRGEDGNDQAWGGDGTDTLRGGLGADSLRGDAGDDTIYGEDGAYVAGSSASAGNQADSIWGGIGNDTIHGGFGDDKLYGEAGIDRIFGDDGNDRIEGGAGDDILRDRAGTNAILGGAGNDDIEGGSGADTVQGGTENDRIVGNAGNDVLQGEAGDDRLEGWRGSDALAGGDGNDLLYGGGSRFGDGADTGIDHLDGGAGNDRLSADDGPGRITLTQESLFLDASSLDQPTGSFMVSAQAAGEPALVVADAEDGVGINGVDLGDPTSIGGDEVLRVELQGSAPITGINLSLLGLDFDSNGDEPVYETAQLQALNASGKIVFEVGFDAGNPSLSLALDASLGAVAIELSAGPVVGVESDFTVAFLQLDAAQAAAGSEGPVETLTGGSGADVFEIRLDGGLVRITDFVEGEDTILINGVGSDSEVESLVTAARSAGASLDAGLGGKVLAFGTGAGLIIDSESNFDASWFAAYYAPA